jgi:hypothetical protein
LRAGELGVIVVVEPVGAPLVAHARRDRRARAGWPASRRRAGARERDGRRCVAPRVARVLEAAARGLLPLGLGRQPRPPTRRRPRPRPTTADDRLTRIGRSRRRPERRRRGAGRRQDAAKSALVTGVSRSESVDPHECAGRSQGCRTPSPSERAGRTRTKSTAV